MTKTYTVSEVLADLTLHEGVSLRLRVPSSEINLVLLKLYSEVYPERMGGERTVDELKERLDAFMFKHGVPRGTEIDWTKTYNIYSVQWGGSIDQSIFMSVHQSDDLQEARVWFNDHIEGDAVVLNTITREVEIYEPVKH